MPAKQGGFQAVQKQMTDWLREPHSKPAPAVELRRLTVYRELFFNNVSDFVETAYPVLKSLLARDEWDGLLMRFFAEHRCVSPYFRDISLEFRTWIESTQGEWQARHPWAVELLHYEWVELAAECAEAAADNAACQPDGDLLAGIPVVQPCVWPLVYRWPVHALSTENPPTFTPPAAPVCLLVFRNSEDAVNVLEVNPVSARLMEILQTHALCSGRDVLLQLAAEAGYTGTAVDGFVQAGAVLMETLRQHGVIRGIRLNGIKMF